MRNNPQGTLSSSCFQRGPCRAPQTRRQRGPVRQPVPAVRGQLRHRQWRGEHLGRPAGPAVHRHLAVRGPQRQPGDHQRYGPGAGLVFEPRAPSCGRRSERPRSLGFGAALTADVTLACAANDSRKDSPLLLSRMLLACTWLTSGFCVHTWLQAGRGHWGRLWPAPVPSTGGPQGPAA